jgi:serralysin
LLILALVSLVATPTFGQEAPVIYKSQKGQTMELVPWYGTKVVVLTRDAKHDARIMKALVLALDKAYIVYERITGSEPAPNPDAMLNGLDIVAEVRDAETACGGAACSYLGIFGSEIGTTYFNELYDGIRLNGEYDQAMFYEFGRTFWFYQNQLGKLEPIVTGFAISNRFISLDRAGLKGGRFGKLSYSNFRKSVLIDLLDGYLKDPHLTWRNTLLLDKAPPNENGWSAADLAGSMIYRIYRDFGFAGYKAFWKSLAKQPAAKVPDDAIHNFLTAAKIATGRDYAFLFREPTFAPR